MEWATTSTILASLADFRNQSAWGRFATQFREPIVRFALRLGLSASAAEDVAQETLLAFAEAFRQGRYDRERGRLRDWLFGIASRQIANRRRADARRRGKERDERSAFWHNTVDPEVATTAWESEWTRAVLAACLLRVRQEVEPMTMRAFDAVVREGRPVAAAARDLHLSVKAVYNARYTVLRRIRELRAEFEL
ncbi:MAG: RNA polymerase sigma factor [Phycisphaerae bacterium]